MNTEPAHPAPDDRCPCGSGETFALCCGPVLRQERQAPTASALMRSRFTAFASGDTEHLLRSWHPSTRPSRAVLSESLAPDIRWLRLSILSTQAGGPFDSEGVVEFEAIAKTRGERHVHQETSRFMREAGTWFYIDGTVDTSR